MRARGTLGRFGEHALWPPAESNHREFRKASKTEKEWRNSGGGEAVLHRQALELENGVQETPRSVVRSVSREQQRARATIRRGFLHQSRERAGIAAVEFVICQCRDDDGVGSASRSTLLRRAVSLKFCVIKLSCTFRLVFSS